MGTFAAGYFGVSDASVAIQNNITPVIDQFYVNFAPFFTRLQRQPVETPDFQVTSYGYRPRSFSIGATITAAGSAGAAGTLTFLDASYLQMGDIIELSSGEQVECTANPDTNANTIAVRRQISGSTTAGITYTASPSSGSAAELANTAYLVSNSRTGAEIDQQANAFKPTTLTYYCQTFQYPVQVGGSAETTRQFLPMGQSTPFTGQRMVKLTDMARDIETGIYYNKPEAFGANGNTRRKMAGLRSLIRSTNVTTAPTNASTYRAEDYVRDVLLKAKTGGGYPDVIGMSTLFMQGLFTWGHALQRIVNPQTGAPYQTAMGVNINMFRAPFLEDIVILEAPLLRGYTSFALTSSDVKVRVKRDPYWNPRAIRGDATEGEWLGELGLDCEHPSYHAWVEGVTAFAA
jgi:hypothetical protein